VGLCGRGAPRKATQKYTIWSDYPVNEIYKDLRAETAIIPKITDA
jgi:hypothetical protein